MNLTQPACSSEAKKKLRRLTLVTTEQPIKTFYFNDKLSRFCCKSQVQSQSVSEPVAYSSYLSFLFTIKNSHTSFF